MRAFVQEQAGVHPEDQVKVFEFTYPEYCVVVSALAHVIELLELPDIVGREDVRGMLVATKAVLAALAPS